VAAPHRVHGKPGKVMEFLKRLFPGMENTWEEKKIPTFFLN